MAGDIWLWWEHLPFAPDSPLCMASVRILEPLGGHGAGVGETRVGALPL